MRILLTVLLLATAACGGASSDAPATAATTPAPAAEPAPATEPAPADGDLPPEVVTDVEKMLELLVRIADAVEAGGCDGIGARLDAAVTDADVAMMEGYTARQGEYEAYQAQIEAAYQPRFVEVFTRIVTGSQDCGDEVRTVFERLGISVE